METYPDWKIYSWRFIRTFLATLGVQLLLVSAVLSNTDKLVIALETAAIVALAKALRDTFSEKDEESVINKIPL